MELEDVLGSRSKVRILKALSAGREMQLSEISKSAKTPLSVVHRSLKDLVETRTLIVRKVGKTHLYQINKSSHIARSIITLLAEEKTVFDRLLKEYVDMVKSVGILNMTLFGSFARGEKEPGDIDILVVCMSGKAGIKEKVAETEGTLLEKYDIRVSSIVIEEKELKEKAQRNEGFIINIIAEGKRLYGRDLEELAYGEGSR